MKLLILMFLLVGAVATYVHFKGVDFDSMLAQATAEPTKPVVPEEPPLPIQPAEAPKSNVVELTDVDGRTLSCRLVSWEGDMLSIDRMPDGERFEFPFYRLDAKSQDIVRERIHQKKAKEPSHWARYQEAKEHVRVIVVVSENIDQTPEVKRFLTANDFHYVVYDAFKSSRGRELLEEHGLTHGPAFIIGDVVIVGGNAKSIQNAIIKEYESTKQQ